MEMSGTMSLGTSTRSFELRQQASQLQIERLIIEKEG